MIHHDPPPAVCWMEEVEAGVGGVEGALAGVAEALAEESLSPDR
jgi:hypothetical protein